MFDNSFISSYEKVTKYVAPEKRRQRAERARMREQAHKDFQRRFKERWGVDLDLPPPTLTGGEHKDYNQVTEKYSQLVLHKGKLVEQIFRRGVSTPAFVDQLTFVIDKPTCENLFNEHKNLQTDEDYVINLSFWLFEIFGFGVSHNRDKSANFYSKSYNLGSLDVSYGIVAIGGDLSESNKNTICVELTATGLNAAKEGWERRLYDWSMLKEVINFRYTRIDLAHDFLDGSYTVDHALSAYKNDGFTNSFTKPKLRLDGDDWYNNTKNGRTLYVGSRLASRLLRFYEKGKQLGMQESPWVRCELELRNRDLIIPKDVVIYPGEYLSSSYPALAEIFKCNIQKRCIIKQRVVQRTVEHVVKYLRMQGSKAVNMLLDLGKTDKEILKIFNPDFGLPKDVNPGEYFCELLKIDFIHTKFCQQSDIAFA